MNLLHRAVFAIRHCLTNEESRYTLNHIKVTENEAQATNGHIALQVQLNGIENENFPSEVPGLKAIKPVSEDVEEIRLSKPTADKLFKALPKNGLVPVLGNAYIGQDGEKPVIAVTDLDSCQVFRTDEVNGQFPDLDALKKEEPPKASVCIDAFYLNEMCKVLRDFQGIKQGESPIIFECWDKDDAIVMSARNDTGQKLRAYLMPMAYDDDEFLFRTPAQQEAEAKTRAEELEKKTEAEGEQVSTYIVPADAPEGTEIIAEEDKDALSSYVKEEDDPAQQGNYQGDDVMKTPPENIGLEGAQPAPDPTDDEDPDRHELREVEFPLGELKDLTDDDEAE